MRLLLLLLLLSGISYGQNTVQYVLVIPQGAGANKVLTSDALGVATWGIGTTTLQQAIKNNNTLDTINHINTAQNPLTIDSVVWFQVNTVKYPDGMITVLNEGGVVVIGDYGASVNGCKIEIADSIGLLNITSSKFISLNGIILNNGVTYFGNRQVFNASTDSLVTDFTGTEFTLNSSAPLTIYSSGTTAWKPTSTGTAPPATTPIYIGQMFVDTTNKKAYISVGTSSSADWELLN